MVSMKLVKEMLREEDYSSCVMKRSCAGKYIGLKRGSREKQDIVWVEIKLRFILYWLVKKNRKYLKNVKAISWELQHRLVVRI